MAEIERIREALLHHMRSIPPEGEMVNYKNRKFVVHKGVFWMPENAVSLEKWDIRPGDDVLDVGTVSGLIAIIAAAKGAKSVLAVDINPAAVACAKDNAARNGFAHTIEVRQSDVFDAIGNEQFDVITANLPFTKNAQNSCFDWSTTLPLIDATMPVLSLEISAFSSSKFNAFLPFWPLYENSFIEPAILAVLSPRTACWDSEFLC